MIGQRGLTASVIVALRRMWMEDQMSDQPNERSSRPNRNVQETARKLREAGAKVIEPQPKRSLEPARMPSLQRELRDLRSGN